MVDGPEQNAAFPSDRSSDSFFQDTTIALGALLLLGFVLRAFLAYRNVYPSYDGTYYLNTARDLVALGEFYRSGFPPGYPLLMAPILLNLGPSDPQAPLLAGQVVNVVSGTLLALLSYHLSRREHGKGTSLAIASAVLFLPLALQLSASDLSEPSFACFLVAGWMLYSQRRYFGAGCGWGFAYLIRPESLLIMAILIVLDLLRRRWSVLNFIAGAAVFVLPYVALLSLSSGHLQLSAKTSFLVRAAQEHPGGSFLSHYLANGWELLRLAAAHLGAPLLLLAAWGLLFRPRNWIVCLAPLVVLPAFAFRMDARYLLPFIPFVLLASVDGGAWIVDRTGARARRTWVAIALLTCALISLGIVGVQQRGLLRGNLEYFPAMRSAGLWLRERVTRETLVAGRKPYVSYWAWCRFARIPDSADLPSILEWCEQSGCEYLVVHVGVTLGMAPALTPLLAGGPEDLAERFSLVGVFRVQGQPDETTMIYRIKGRGDS